MQVAGWRRWDDADMSMGSLDDFHREAKQQADAMAEQFRKQFSEMPNTELVGLLEFLKCGSEREFVVKLKATTVQGEPLWSFCATSAALIVMTELGGAMGDRQRAA